MLKNYWRLVSRIERVTDNIVILLAFVLAYYLRDGILTILENKVLPIPNEASVLAPLTSYLIVLGFSLPLFNAALSLQGGYRSMRFSSLWELLRLGAVAALLVFFALGSLFYLLKLDFSRSFVGTFCLLSGALIFLERVVVLRVLRYFRLQGKNYRNLLIFGVGPQAELIHRQILQQPELGVRVTGFVSAEEAPLPERGRLVGNSSALYAVSQPSQAPLVKPFPMRIVATPETFEGALKRYAVDEVIFTDVVQHYSLVDELSQIASEEGVRVTLVADLFSRGLMSSDISFFGTLPLIHYQASPSDSMAMFAKRGIDILVSALLLIVLFPFMCAIALLIKLDSSGPVFFRQRRVGLNGRRFVLLKFRSMVLDADKQLHALRKQNEMSGPVFKLKVDPRVTRVGRFIRRHSIDELPQLWNVLKGDMSLVGPRPPLPEEVRLYLRKQRRRLSMRPGLTCIWQVSGRNEIPDFETWAKLDLEYIDNWSLVGDLKLLMRTIPAVLYGTGAR